MGFLFFFRKKPLSSNFIRIDKGEALGCRAQSTRPAAQRKFRLGFPVFFLSYAKRWRVAFEGGCSPWMPRAILPDEIPCCRRQHGTKQRQRAEGIPVGIPLFLIRKGRFLPILSASTRAKPLDATCNPLGPPRRGNSGWDSPFSSRPIRNADVSLSRGLKPLDTACNPPSRSPVLPSAARDEAEATGRGNPGWDSPLSYSKRPLSSNFIRSDKGEALGCRAQSTRPAAQRKFRLGFPVFFPSYPQRRRVAFAGGRSPWILRAILPDEIPCCLRRHETKQRQRAEGIPVSF